MHRHERTHRSEFTEAIIRSLLLRGGRAHLDDVLQDVENALRDRLTEVDWLPVSPDATEPRWRNSARWARKELVLAGVLAVGTARGVWALSDTFLTEFWTKFGDAVRERYRKIVGDDDRADALPEELQRHFPEIFGNDDPVLA